MSDLVAAIGADDSGPHAHVKEVGVGAKESPLISAAWMKILVGAACTIVIGTGGVLVHLLFDYNSRLAVLETQNLHHQRQLDKIDGKIDQLLTRGK